MKTSFKIITLLAIVAAASIGTEQVYAETSTVIASELNIVEFVAVLSAVGGALVAVGQGIADSPTGTKISRKKVISAIITAITGSMLVVNLSTLSEQTAGLSLLAIVIMFGLLGYGSDKGLARLDK